MSTPLVGGLSKTAIGEKNAAFFEEHRGTEQVSGALIHPVLSLASMKACTSIEQFSDIVPSVT